MRGFALAFRPLPFRHCTDVICQAGTPVSAAYQPWHQQSVGGGSITQQAMLVLEDLTGIRERANRDPRPKRERRHSNSWAFSQLRAFVTYKAALVSVLLVLHPPAYTSQMCHACLHLGHRHAKRFTCTNPLCGWCGDADWNAAQNLAILGLNLSQPRGPWLHSQLQGSQKPHALEA